MVLDGQVTDVLSRMDVSFHSQVAADHDAAKKPEPTNSKATGGTPLRYRIASAASLTSSKVGNGRPGVKESQGTPAPNGSLHGASMLERKLSRAMLSFRSESQLAEPHPADTLTASTVPVPGAVVPAGHAMNGSGSLQPPVDATCEVTLSPRSTATPVATPKKPIKWLAFLSHHKQDGGDAARVFVDTARRIFNAPPEDGGADANGTLSSISASLRDELIFLDSSNLSDLRRLLDHVEESANYILMLTRSALERPWVLAELVRAHKHGKRMLIICASWPGDESSPQGRGFKFPTHLDEAIDEWQEYYYESTLRSKAMSEASERESRFAKLLAGSLLFQRLKAKVAELLRNQQERPTNASTWVPERWEIVSNALKDSTTTFSRAISSWNFKPLAETEA